MHACEHLATAPLVGNEGVVVGVGQRPGHNKRAVELPARVRSLPGRRKARGEHRQRDEHDDEERRNEDGDECGGLGEGGGGAARFFEAEGAEQREDERRVG